MDVLAERQSGPLTAQELRTYQDVWEALPDAYGERSPGEIALPIFLEHAVTGPGRELLSRGTVLDAGCGSGKAMIGLADAGFEPLGFDLLDVRVDGAKSFPFYRGVLWKPIRPVIQRGMVDWVYCCDVLEHVPPQLVGLTIDQLLRIAEQGCFFTVSLTEDKAGFWVGYPLHQTVRPYRWWWDTLAELGTIVEGRDLLGQATFLVTR